MPGEKLQIDPVDLDKNKTSHQKIISENLIHFYCTKNLFYKFENDGFIKYQEMLHWETCQNTKKSI